MTDHEKVLKLMVANSKLRNELCDISGACAGSAKWTEDKAAQSNFKEIESRIDSALKDDNITTEKIIYGETLEMTRLDEEKPPWS